MQNGPNMTIFVFWGDFFVFSGPNSVILSYFFRISGLWVLCPVRARRNRKPRVPFCTADAVGGVPQAFGQISKHGAVLLGLTELCKGV